MVLAPFALVAGPAVAAPISGAVTLYLHSCCTGAGNVDWFFTNGTYMDAAPPTILFPPAVYHSAPLLTGNPNPSQNNLGAATDANWYWRPAEGYSYTNAKVNVTFFTTSLGNVGDPLNSTNPSLNGWNVSLWQTDSTGHKLVAFRAGGGVLKASTPFIDTPEYTVTLEGVTMAGSALTLQIHPFYIDLDWAHVIYYDSTIWNSRVEIKPASGVPDTTPPSEVTGLAVGGATPSSLSLSWNNATDNVGVTGYKVYRGTTAGGPYTLLGTPAANSHVDTALSAATTYFYRVSAVDAAANEGSQSAEASGTTLPPDTTPPVISGPSAQTGATAARVTFSTDENATGVIDFGPTSSYGRSVSVPLGAAHKALLTGLVPATTYHYRITATDGSGNAASTVDAAFATSPDLQYWFHNVGGATSMNEFNDAGDAHGFGWNVLGGAIGTYQYTTGTDIPFFGGVGSHSFPTASPANTGLALNSSRLVTGSVHLAFNSTAGAAHVGLLEVELAVFANGGELVGKQIVANTAPPSSGYVEFAYFFPPLLTSVEAASLVAKVSTSKGTGYKIGTEGDHASSITLPALPIAPLDVTATISSAGNVVEDVASTFQASAVGGSPPYAYSWAFSDGGVAAGASVSHAFASPGAGTAAVTVTDSVGGVASDAVEFRVLQRDFVAGSRAVVAVIDTGVNPYHPVYQRPGAVMPLSSFVNSTGLSPPASVVTLSGSGDYSARVAADDAIWDGMDAGEFVYFSGTNVFGISFHDPTAPAAVGDQRIRDFNGHGTWTSSTVLANFPDATIVMVQPTVVSSGAGAGFTIASLEDALAWVVDQPWIDVVSISVGALANVPLGGGTIPALEKDANDAGKVVVVAAGNDPSPLPTDSLDGAPWVLSVSGSQADGQAKEIFSSYLYSDYVSSFTVNAAAHDSTGGDYVSVSGTSFSCPTVAGTVAGIVHGVRSGAGYTGGIAGGELSPGVSNIKVRAALNRTALLPPWSGYTFGFHALGDHTHPPGAEYLTAGWGHVDGSIIDPAIAAIQSGTLGVPPEKANAALWKSTTHMTRELWWL